jgi:AraC-like DNA-binding protein
MRVTALPPGARLAPFVRQFNVVEADEETTRTLLPEAGLVMGFRFGGSASIVRDGSTCRVPDVTLAGFRDTVRRMRTSARGGVILAVFREEGAAPFLPVPLHELFGATIALDAVAARSVVEETRDRIASASDHVARARIFEQFLLAHQRMDAGDPLVAAAVRAIRAAPGAVRIGTLASELGLSQDRLEKRFRRAVGASPKQLASVLRLRAAVRAHRPGLSLARLSAEAGYFDESHMSRAFRSATGDAPGRFFGSPERC